MKLENISNHLPSCPIRWTNPKVTFSILLQPNLLVKSKVIKVIAWNVPIPSFHGATPLQWKHWPAMNNYLFFLIIDPFFHAEHTQNAPSLFIVIWSFRLLINFGNEKSVALLFMWKSTEIQKSFQGISLLLVHEIFDSMFQHDAKISIHTLS